MSTIGAKSSFVRLVFVHPFDDAEADEARDRGYLSHVLVETDDGALYPVTFYDSVRLEQDLADNAAGGDAFIGDVGLIVLREITRDSMTHAASKLCQQGYFRHLRPISREQLAAADPLEWPPRSPGP